MPREFINYNVQFNDEVVESFSTMDAAVKEARRLVAHPQCKFIASVVEEKTIITRKTLQHFHPTSD